MLLFMDGMGHYDSAGIPLKYSAMLTDNTVWSVAAEGRFGNCIKRVATSNNVGGYLDIAPLVMRSGVYVPTSGGVCGFALKVDDLTRNVPNENGPSSEGSLLAILDQANFALKVIVNPSGTFSLVQPWGPLDNYGFPIATSAEGLQNGAWAYVECKWVIHASAGSFEIRVNTVPILTYTGDTSSHNPSWSASGNWNAVRLQHSQSLTAPYLTTRMCDLYLADLTFVDADDAHDFLGDGVIDTIMPNGVGSSTGWTPTGAATNWDATNDRPSHDGDGTYVSATPTDTQDTYQFEDIPASSVVKGVHWNLLARKEEEGSVVVAPVVRQGTTDYIGPSQGVASTVYDRYLTQPYDTNPATMAPWTAAEVNAGQWGVKKVL